MTCFNCEDCLRLDDVSCSMADLGACPAGDYTLHWRFNGNSYSQAFTSEGNMIVPQFQKGSVVTFYILDSDGERFTKDGYNCFKLLISAENVIE